jgi:hypothetical protein
MPNLGPITGVGITTRVGMESADLGIMRWDPQRGAIAAVFGDNFTDWRMGGEWQSPSIIMYDNNFQVLGIPTVTGIASEGNRRQAIPYQHANEDFSTILPCDLIRLQGIWYMAAMVTAGLGHEKRTVFWQSHNLVDWQKTDPYVRLDHLDEQLRPIGHPGNTMLTFDQLGDWVYVFGTGGLSRDRPIYLWRCAASTFPHGLWQPWGMDHVGWAWGNPNETTPVLPGRYGELSFRLVQGNAVLSFFDAERYCQTALCATVPEANWSQANKVDYAFGLDTPQLYGGYIAPPSSLDQIDGMRLIVSQWNTANNDPYHCLAFSATLPAAGPLVEVTPEPEPAPAPAPQPKPPPAPAPKPLPISPLPGAPMTPQELYELLLRELSASGSVKISTPEGDQLTLREAIEQIFTKQRAWYQLTGRPRHPGEDDDQLGHVLSSRAEGLFNQALLVAIAEKQGIDTGKLYAQVQRSLQ